jgi:GNAT superfamily N-acetyltransferase
MKATLREYSEADLPALREIYLLSRRAAFTWELPDWFRVDDLDRAIEGEVILVAEIERMPVGFVSWWPPENFIHHLFLHPDYFRRGIGSQLLQACLDRLGRPARLKCISKNLPAKEFYLQRGWVVESKGTGCDGDYLTMALE